jgi:inosine-uridine nucleoside N-ribohydrolase
LQIDLRFILKGTYVTFPAISNELRLARLEPPKHKVRIVLDTDTFNEVDDQFAIVHALLSPERVQLEALYAAPFHNRNSSSPEDGMEKSYQEILTLFKRMNRSPDGLVYKGSRHYFNPDNLERSAAVDELIARALASKDEPLYVVAIAAISNIATAIMLEPRIIENIVVVWLGGHSLTWPHTKEFNLMQDVAGANVLFDSGVPLVLVPCMGVTSHLTTTIAELETFVAPCGPIGEFLTQRVKGYHPDHFAWAKELWDIAAIAYLLDDTWLPSRLVPTPKVSSEVTWEFSEDRHLMRVIDFVSRNAVFADLFRKLEVFSKG